MTHRKNHHTNPWWEAMCQPVADQKAKLADVSKRKNEWCQYRDNCLLMVAKAERYISELAAEELELIVALQALEGEERIR